MKYEEAVQRALKPKSLARLKKTETKAYTLDGARLKSGIRKDDYSFDGVLQAAIA